METIDSKKRASAFSRIFRFIGIFLILGLMTTYFFHHDDLKTSGFILPVITVFFTVLLAFGFLSNGHKLNIFSARTFTGIIFTFSGFVKAVDPYGFTYKLHDYFVDGFNMPEYSKYAFALAILFSAIEFALGVALLFNIKTKLSLIGVTLFMLVFTPLTFYLAWYNPVHDCGCFGDALILSNWETFFKNIIINVFVITLLSYYGQLKNLFNPKTDFVFLLILSGLATGFCFYNISHLPLMDFRPFKEGASIIKGMEMPEGVKGDEYAYDYTMKNLQTDETKVIDSKQYISTGIWEDTTWTIVETSEPYLIKKGYTPPIHDLTMISNEPFSVTGIPVGEDKLQSALKDKNMSFWLVAYDLTKADLEGMKHAEQLAKVAKKNKLKFYCLTSSSQEYINDMREKIQPSFHFFATDPITLKTIVRANPGLVALKEGVVVKKWHYNDFPQPEDLLEDTNEAYTLLKNK